MTELITIPDTNEIQFKIERDVLGLIAYYGDKALRVNVNPDCFLHPDHRAIYEWILSNPPRNGDWDYDKMFGDLGDHLAILFTDMMGNGLPLASLLSRVEMLEDRRQEVEVQKLNHDRQTGAITALEYSHKIAEICQPVRQEIKRKTPEEIADLVLAKDDVLQFRFFRCFKYGLPLAECCTHVLAGYTSRGKSAFAMNMMNDLAASYRILYFNLEMRDNKVWKRFTAIHTETPMKDIVMENPVAYDMVRQTVNDLQGNGLDVFTGSHTLEQIRSIILSESAKCKKPPVVVIDHIQYIQLERRGLEERLQLSEIMKTLNGLAKDGKCTPILLSQINRSGSEEANLNHLQGSAAIAQDADNVLILEYENKDEIEKSVSLMKLKAQKARDGQTGMFLFEFDKPRQIFRDVTQERR